MSFDLPSWCRVRRGEGTLLFVAPHGGKRANDSLTGAGHMRLKINDLHTADLSDELARRLGGSLLANDLLDRNDVDLNRIPEVAKAAPVFLETLDRMVGEIARRHGRAEVVFVHGWHVVQPRVDVGLGVALASEAAAAASESRLAVSADYVTTRLASFRAASEARGIPVAYGERYPASSPSNLVQLFRRMRDAGEACLPAAAQLAPRILAAAAAGKTQAFQLELGVPLRWDGQWRERFLEAMVEAWGGAGTALPTPSIVGEIAPVAGPLGLRAYDAEADLGILVGLGPSADGTLGGRLLLFPGGQKTILFTGEERCPDGLTVGGLRAERLGDRLRFTFRGPAVAVADGLLYLRTEAALERAELCSVEADVSLACAEGREYGEVTGWIVVDGRERTVRAFGFADGGFAAPVGRRRRRRATLALAFGSDLGLRVDFGDEDEEEDARIGYLAGGCVRDERSGRGRVVLDGDRFTPARFDLSLGDASTLTAEPISRMAILRPAGPRAFTRITFGIARVTFDGRSGSGFYELATALREGE